MNKLVKSLFTFVLIAVILLVLSSCKNNSDYEKNISSTSENIVEDTSSSLVNNSNNKEDISNAQIQINQLTDEVLNQYESFHEFLHEEKGEWLVFVTDKIIKDFEYIKVDHYFIDEHIVFFVDYVKYSFGELTPQKPCLIKTYTSYGTMPQYGVSYIDTDNVKRYFYIFESGMDGSLLLVEFENENI